MTYDTTASRSSYNEWIDWARTPGFHPLKVVAVIAGFAIFPPLGILALIYFIWNSRRASSVGANGRIFAGGCGRRRGSGNRAFDEHRAKVLEELEAERTAFHTFRAEERRKRDQAEFDAFRNRTVPETDE